MWSREHSQQEIWSREEGNALFQVKRLFYGIRWEIYLDGDLAYWGSAKYIKTAQAAADRCWSLERNYR